MIRCNLSVLLAEQNLKITKVSNDTGISRTTLTALANNYGQGIQFDTINKLCMYLKVGPEQLIAFAPVDIKINSVSLDMKSIKDNKSSVSEIELIITERGKNYDCSLCGNIVTRFIREGSNEIDEIDIDIELWNSDDNENIREEIKEENQIIINAIKQLSRPFLNDLETNIFQALIFQLEYGQEYILADEVGFNCNWPSNLLLK